MSDQTTLAKIVIVLGVVFIMIGGMYPGQDAGWNSLRKAISSGPVFPAFNNPFNQNFLAATLVSNASQGTFTSVTGCPTTSYWQCIASNDGNKSYITLHDTFQQFSYNLSAYDPTGMEVTAATVDIWCRSNQTQTFKIFVDSYRTDESYRFNCPVSSDRQNASFSQVSFNLRPICGPLGTNTYCTWFSNNFTHQKIFILTEPAGPNPKGFTDFTYIQFNMYTNRQTPCTGNSFDAFGCQVSRFFIGIANGILFVINAVSFGVAVLYAIILFIGGIISGFLLGLFSTMSWFLAVPNAPAPIQGIFAALFIGLMGFLLVIVVKIVRGQQG